MQLPECMFSLRAKYLYDYIGFTVFTFTSIPLHTPLVVEKPAKRLAD